MIFVCQLSSLFTSVTISFPHNHFVYFNCYFLEKEEERKMRKGFTFFSKLYNLFSIIDDHFDQYKAKLLLSHIILINYPSVSKVWLGEHYDDGLLFFCCRHHLWKAEPH